MDTFVGKSQKIRIDVSSIEIESKNLRLLAASIFLVIRSPRLTNEGTPFLLA